MRVDHSKTTKVPSLVTGDPTLLCKGQIFVEQVPTVVNKCETMIVIYLNQGLPSELPHITYYEWKTLLLKASKTFKTNRSN